MSTAIADAMLKLFFDNQQSVVSAQPSALSSSQLLKQLDIAEIAARKNAMWQAKANRLLRSRRRLF